MKITNPILPEQEYNHDYFLQFTQKLNKISCVSFAFYAVKLVCHLNFDPLIINCVNLIEKWLKNPNSVKIIELNNAADEACTVFDMDNVAWAVTYASWAVYINISASASAAYHAVHADASTKNKLLNYLGYLLPKEPELNNFNIDLLKQNPQAYSFLETISKLEDHQVTNEDLFGIRQIFDVLEEVGAPLDPNEFVWDGDVIEKHKLLQSIRREFCENY